MAIGKNFRRLMVGVVLGCGSLATGAVYAETWVCREFDLLGAAIGGPVLVAETGETDGIGSVAIDGSTHSARYEIRETNRLWLWGGGPGGTSPFAFRIHPDGSGALFDLSVVDIDEIAPAAQRLICGPA